MAMAIGSSMQPTSQPWNQSHGAGPVSLHPSCHEKQTEMNSSERLAILTAPKYYLVLSGPGNCDSQASHECRRARTNENQENPLLRGDSAGAPKSGTRSYVVCDFWTDINDWRCR